MNDRMKWITFTFLLMATHAFSQLHGTKTKISQTAHPDASIGSTVIVTRVFAKDSASEAWFRIYRSEVAVTKTKFAKDVKAAEYDKAVLAERKWLGGGAVKDSIVRKEPEFTK